MTCAHVVHVLYMVFHILCHEIFHNLSCSSFFYCYASAKPHEL